MATRDGSSQYSPTKDNLILSLLRLRTLIKERPDLKDLEIQRRIDEVTRWKAFRKTARTTGIIQFIECEIEALRKMEGETMADKRFQGSKKQARRVSLVKRDLKRAERKAFFTLWLKRVREG